MSNNNINNTNDEFEFEKMMEERIKDNFSVSSADEIVDERLKEMNKKLPSWDLEPPFTFIK